MTCFRLDFCYKKGEKNEEKGEWAFWGLQKESSWGRQRASARDPPMSFCLVSRESFAFHCHQILFEPLKYISVLKWESFFLSVKPEFSSPSSGRPLDRVILSSASEPLLQLQRMKQSKDPFEAALEEQEESPPDPVGEDELNSHTPNEAQNQTEGAQNILVDDDDDYDGLGSTIKNPSHPSSSSTPKLHSTSVNASVTAAVNNKNKEYDDDEEEENVDVELSKFPSSADPTKMAKMQAILSQFTEVQMSRYESFRRSALQKSNMRRLLVSITGSQKISLPMTIVVCGIAKMFVGELVEKARMVMTERKESGPIRPCHIREAYRRLKLEGKVPRRSVQRLFR
ncbi:hypothetical protein V6N12_015890 [Hibiscus sabdariffa]|uniref:TAFII28-like protein domain-containing protein n=1 Tax=Hibiscus sabdariffa TaxID=183260 RepID=A0ABR2DPH9_9ROSI